MKKYLILFTLISGSLSAQEMVRLTGDPSKMYMIKEVGAMISTTDEKHKVVFAAPAQARTEKNKEVDIATGDEVVMVNGKKIKSAKEIEKIYEQLAVGEELKLGLKRNDNMLIAKIVKASADEFPKGGMTIRREIGPDGKEKVTDGNGKEVKVKDGKAIINGKEIDLSKPPKDAKIEIED